jgi:hypothetical protein
VPATISNQISFPTSDALADRCTRYREAESIWAQRACIFSPVLAIIAVPLVHHFLLWVMYLQPIPSGWQFTGAFRSKISLAAGLAVAAVPWVWWIGLKLDSTTRRHRMPSAVVLSLVATFTCCLALNSPRATWFFVEWVKPRTPNPSFARNTLFWEQRSFERRDNDQATENVGFIGSSQTYQGVDLNLLQRECKTLNCEKNTLAGFGPMQYPFLLNRIQEREFDTVVCHLSEFDFFREDSVPVNRLRWAASTQGVASLLATLSPQQKWANRGEMADLTFAAVVPLWRQRDHFRRTVFGYWWKKSDPPITEPEAETRLADASALSEAIGFLKQNIGHKDLVEANFESFEQFARNVHRQNIELIVLEGFVHPEARAAYDRDGLQKNTRKRLSEMAAENGFSYLNESQLPELTATDFADAYHVNEVGRQKLSAFLGSYLSQLTPSN